MSIIQTLAKFNQAFINQSRIEILSLDQNVVKRCFGTSLSNIPLENNYKDYFRKKEIKSLQNSVIRFNNHHSSFHYDDSPISQYTQSLNSQFIYCRQILQNLNCSQQQIVLYKKQYIKQRNIIVNWITLIHQKYQFQIHTLYQAVSFINRYLSIKSLQIQDYQKLAITSLWMAAKLQQRKVHELRAWLNFGKGFNITQIVEMQSSILQILSFNLIVPNTLNYFLLFCYFYKLDQKTTNLCKYIIELTLIDCNYTRFKHNQIALSAIYLSFKILNIDQWKDKLMMACNLSLGQIRECASELCKSIQLAQFNQLSSVYRKYSSKKYNSIGKIKLGRKVHLNKQ